MDDITAVKDGKANEKDVHLLNRVAITKLATVAAVQSKNAFFCYCNSIKTLHAVFLVFLGFLYAMSHIKACVTSSTRIHDNALNRVLRSSITFFDITPLGRYSIILFTSRL